MIWYGLAVFVLTRRVWCGDVWEPADVLPWSSRTSAGRTFSHDGTLRDTFYAEPRTPHDVWWQDSVRLWPEKKWSKDRNIWKERQPKEELWFGRIPQETAQRFYRIPKDSEGLKDRRPFVSPLRPNSRSDLRKRSWNSLKKTEIPSWIPKGSKRSPPRNKIDSLSHRYPRTASKSPCSDIAQNQLKSGTNEELVDLNDSWEPDAQWSSIDCEETWLPHEPDACVISKPDEDELYPKFSLDDNMSRLLPRSVPKVSFIDKIKNIIFGQLPSDETNQTEITASTTEKTKKLTRQPYLPAISNPTNASRTIVVKIVTAGYTKSVKNDTTPSSLETKLLENLLSSTTMTSYEPSSFEPSTETSQSTLTSEAERQANSGTISSANEDISSTVESERNDADDHDILEDDTLELDNVALVSKTLPVTSCPSLESFTDYSDFIVVQ